MDYGDGINKTKQLIEGGFYLSPGQKRQISVSVSRENIDYTKRRYNINDIIFSLRVVINRPSGKKIEKVRSFGGFIGQHFIMTPHFENVL
jgi:hypothetical protein